MLKNSRLLISESSVDHKNTWIETLEKKKLLLINLNSCSWGVIIAHYDMKTRDFASRGTEDSFNAVLLPFKDIK